jgi:hypothetical protein
MPLLLLIKSHRFVRVGNCAAYNLIPGGLEICALADGCVILEGDLV